MLPFNVTQAEFMDACDQPRHKLHTIIEAFGKGYCDDFVLAKNIALWKELIKEEYERELVPHVEELLFGGCRTHNDVGQTLVDIADDIADVIYVLCGLANCLGIPIHKVFAEVHASNMKKVVTKIGADGKPYSTVERRPDGKILKPASWNPPSIRTIIDRKLHEEKYAGMTPAITDALISEKLIAVRKAIKDEVVNLRLNHRAYPELDEILSQAAKDLCEVALTVKESLPPKEV